MKKIKVEFFHDVICSFCFPMSYRMRQLQASMPEIEIIHRSFGLIKREEDFTIMFGSRKQAKDEIMSHWARANQIDDLHRFNIEGMQQQGFLFPMSMNSLWACKAAYFVGGNASYWDLFDALQAGLFVENKNIEVEEVIFEKVEQAGIDFEKWESYFQSKEVKVAVRKEFELAKKYGLRGIPALVINGTSIVGGAVSLSEIKAVIMDEKKNLEAEISISNSCTIDGVCN